VKLEAVRVEHAERGGARWPINVDNKRVGVSRATGVGHEFANDVRPPVEKLDSVLHGPIRNVPTLSVRPASTSERALASKVFETAFVFGVAPLSLAHDALKLFDRVDFRRRRGALDQVSIVPFAPTSPPTHQG
jgi:hypothetical protein